MKIYKYGKGVKNYIKTINTSIILLAISGTMALNQRSLDLNAAALKRVSLGELRTRDEFHKCILLFDDKTAIRVFIDIAQGLEDSSLEQLYLDPINKILQRAPKYQFSS